MSSATSKNSFLVPPMTCTLIVTIALTLPGPCPRLNALLSFSTTSEAGGHHGAFIGTHMYEPGHMSTPGLMAIPLSLL
jgi:hypothetical protein